MRVVTSIDGFFAVCPDSECSDFRVILVCCHRDDDFRPRYGDSYSDSECVRGENENVRQSYIGITLTCCVMQVRMVRVQSTHTWFFPECP